MAGKIHCNIYMLIEKDAINNKLILAKLLKKNSKSTLANKL